jgi:DnaJ like chaperone protein
MKFLVLLIVGVILYFMTRSYKTDEYKKIKPNSNQKLNTDLKNHEAGLLVALLAKVAKADGVVCELEEEVLKNTFNDISSHFENKNEIYEILQDIYNKEKETFKNTLEIAQKYYKLTRWEYKKRLDLIEHLVNIAFIDGDFSEAEYMIIEDISKTMKIKDIDLDNIINQFKEFYTNKKSSTTQTISQSYKILELEPTEDFSKIKKQYRLLVKKYHPDIITGQGANRSTINDANIKLQEINEAYDIIKKHIGK